MSVVSKVGDRNYIGLCDLQIKNNSEILNVSTDFKISDKSKCICKAVDDCQKNYIFKVVKKELVDYNKRVESQIFSFSNKIGLKRKFLNLTKNTRTILSVITIALNIACLICPVIALATIIVNVTALIINLAMLIALYFISNKEQSLLLSMAGIVISIVTSFWPSNLIAQAGSIIGSVMNFCGFLSYTWSVRKKQQSEFKSNDS